MIAEKWFNSIHRPAGVDVLVPEQDAAGHALYIGEAVLFEDGGELQAAAAGFAEDDHLFLSTKIFGPIDAELR